MSSIDWKKYPKLAETFEHRPHQNVYWRELNVLLLEQRADAIRGLARVANEIKAAALAAKSSRDVAILHVAILTQMRADEYKAQAETLNKLDDRGATTLTNALADEARAIAQLVGAMYCPCGGFVQEGAFVHAEQCERPS